MLTFLAIYGPIVATVALVMAFARTGPDEARSKLSEWAEFFGLKALSRWLSRHALDERVLWYGTRTMFLLTFIGGIALGAWLTPSQPSQIQSNGSGGRDLDQSWNVASSPKGGPLGPIVAVQLAQILDALPKPCVVRVTRPKENYSQLKETIE
jgi:hypothetical protein